MISEQKQWLRAIEQERFALISENVRLRCQLAAAYWALMIVAFGACSIVLWAWG